MFNFVIAADANGGSMNWIMLVVLGVLMVGMILLSVIPQRKRQKQAQEMMAGLRKGDKVKTIGGFVGVIVGFDNGNNTLEIDVSAKQDGSTVVVIDKSAIYTVMNAVPQQNFDESKTVDAGRGQDVVTADDLEADEKSRDRKNKKEAKKAEKAAEKAEKSEEKKVESEEKTTEVSQSDEDADRLLALATEHPEMSPEEIADLFEKSTPENEEK